MTAACRLLVATDRAPMAFVGRPAGIRMSRGSGGVVTALRDLARADPVTWVAPAVLAGDLAAMRGQREHGGVLGSGRLALRLFPMPTDLFADYRTTFADRILWFAQHGLWSRRIDPETPQRIRWLLSRYRLAARRFADALAREVHRPSQSAVVLLHDYQLYLVPAMLRARVPGARIAHFTHIPWPDLPVWRDAIPSDVMVRLLRGLLAADVLHFQTRASVEAFSSSVDELLPDAQVRGERIVHAAGSVLVRARPVSIDPRALRPDPREVARLRADRRRLIVRVDRADPIKNIPAGFLAFERLLERHPRWIGSVRFLARAVPSRLTLPEYVRERDLIHAVVDRINARFGSSTVELSEMADRPRALAELAAADAVLVNSLADGMNLVAKEAVVVGERSALVLSRRAGAYEELAAGAIGIEPTDIVGTSLALHRAIEMPPCERAARLALMRARVRSWTSRDWLLSQLADLDEVSLREDALDLTS